MIPSIILYTTIGCHLCEEARALISPLLANTNWLLKEIDIAEDDDLIARYGIRIPVLSIPASGELDWPFTTQDIISRLDNAS